MQQDSKILYLSSWLVVSSYYRHRLDLLSRLSKPVEYRLSCKRSSNCECVVSVIVSFFSGWARMRPMANTELFETNRIEIIFGFFFISQFAFFSILIFIFFYGQLRWIPHKNARSIFHFTLLARRWLREFVIDRSFNNFSDFFFCWLDPFNVFIFLSVRCPCVCVSFSICL